MTTLAIEGLLIFLLLITICYCFILDRRLKVLRNGHSDLRKVITDLSQTTQIAREAISGLKATADDVDQRLSEKLNEARDMTSQLENLIDAKQQPLRPQVVPAAKQVPAGNAIFLRKAG